MKNWVRDNLLKWPYVATLPLLAAGFSMSCFFTGTDTYWFAPPLLCIFAMAFIAFAPGFSRGWALPRSATVGLVVAFGLYTVISAFWSQAPYISILFAFILTALPLLFLTLLCLPRPLLAARLHVGALGLCLCGFAVWALIQFFFMFEKYGPRIHHPMLSPNNLAVLFVVGMFIATALFMRARGAWAQAGAFALAALMILALVMTQSRGGMFSAIISMTVFMVMCRGRGDGFRWYKPLALAATLGLGIWIVNGGGGGELGRNLSALSQAVQIGSATDRFALYQSSLAILRDNFWGGIGLGTFYFTYPYYRSPTDFSDGYFVHMDPLQYGLEMGILAMVLFYGILIAVLMRTIRAWRRAPKDSGLRVEMMAAFCGMLAVTGHTHIDFHFYILVTLMAVAVPLAWWYAATEEALGETRRVVGPGPRPAWPAQVAFAVALLLLVNWPVRAAISTMTIPQAEAAISAGRLEEADALLDRIVLYSPRNNYRYYQMRGRLAAQILTMKGGEMDRAAAQAVLDEGLAAYEKAIHYNGDFTGPYNDRAKLYFAAHGWLLPDGYALAEKDLVFVNEHNPLDWDARAGLATIYQLQGYFKRAAQVLERGRKWPLPRGPMGVRLMIMEAEMYQRLGDMEGYQTLLHKAHAFAAQYSPPPAAP